MVWLVFCARWPALVDDVLDCAANDADERDCIAAVQASGNGDTRLERFVERLGGDKLSAKDLAPHDTLASAARISQLVRDRPAPRS